MRPLRLLSLFLALGLLTSTPAQAEYIRNAGLLPEKKAAADAERMAEVIREFQKTHLKDKCVKSYDRQGLGKLYDLKDEEGRGTNVPRTGYEVELFKRIKAAMARGEKIDPEGLLKMGLEASVDKNGDVNLQDVFLSIHNVTRLLARPETWWTDHNYVSGVVYKVPGFGGGEITRGKYVPGWRGMQNDPIFPIVKDIFGQEPVEGTGSGAKTMADLAGAVVDQSDPEKAAKMAKKKAEKLESRNKKLEGLKKALAAEQDAGAKKLIQQQIDFTTNEIEQPDISDKVVNIKYTADLFNVPGEDGSGGGLFGPLYGAQDSLGNGGNYYYFWLGTIARGYVGIGAQAGATQYEQMQKWFGDEQEYARGLIQVSHFNGGGELGALAVENSEECQKKKNEKVAGETVQLPPLPLPPPEPGYVGSYHSQKDWYCTNRPQIEAPVALPPIINAR